MKRQIQGQNKYSLFTRLPGPGGCCQSARPSASELAAVQNLLQFQHAQGWDSAYLPFLFQAKHLSSPNPSSGTQL